MAPRIPLRPETLTQSFCTKAVRNHPNRKGEFIDILHTRVKDIKNFTSKKFKGACFDIGAQRSVIGRNQSKAYCRFSGFKFKFSPSRTFFRFGDGCFASLGTIPVRIPCPDGSFLHIDIDVVAADVPMLIGLDVLDREELIVDNVDNLLVSKRYDWTIPITREEGHLFVTWEYSSILFSKRELTKLHYHFYHPSSKKLLELIARARPEQFTPETRTFLDQLSTACRTCQQFASKPQSFKVSFPKDIIFNSILAMDLIKIRSHTVLHVVDLSKNLSAARFLRGDSVADVWSASIQCWASVYNGFPDIIKADQGSVFTATEFETYCTSQGIKIKLFGVESHNSLGAGERYHDPIRRIFDKILFDHPSIDPPIALSVAVKAMNDTMNSNGLVPSLLVFGVPRFPSSSSSHPKQSERMRALTMARLEMETITAELRIQQALLKNIPPASKTVLVLKPGQEVLVYREKQNPHWTGPFKITGSLDKQVFIDRNGTEVQHSVSQVKPYIRDPNSLYSSIQYSLLHPIAPQSSSKPSYSLNSNFLTETLHPSDPRCK